MATRLFRAFLVVALGTAATLSSGCDSGSASKPEVGSVGLSLRLGSGTTLSSVSYTITGPGSFSRAGTIDASNSTKVTTVVGGIPAGSGYSIALQGTTTDGATQCAGSTPFSVTAHVTTVVTVPITCHEPARTGSVNVNGTIDICPKVDGLSASPAEVLVGSSLSLSAAAHDSDSGPVAIAYHWTTTGGTLSAADVASPSLTCTAAGTVTVSVSVTDGDCSESASAMVTCTSSAGTVTSVDLSRYVRVARYGLPEPSRTMAPAGSLLAQEASAVTYDWDTDTLFVTGDGGTSIVQVSKTGALIDSMSLAPGGSPQGTEFYDTEGISYVGGGKFVLIEERDRKVSLFTYVAGATLHRADVQTVELGTTIGNVGLEGLTYDPGTGHYLFVKEKDPRSVFETAIDFAAGTATNGSPTTEASTNLFDPALVPTLDFSDVFALSNLPSLHGDLSFDHLLIISQESGQIVQVDRLGNVKHTLTIVADPGDTISVPDMTMEGMTMDRNGFLYVVNENGGGDSAHPQLWVFAPSTAPNLAPTAVSLTGAVTSLPENANTTTDLKLADIAVADDGLGDNALSLSGSDAASFRISGTALFLKAGTALNAAAQPSYSVTIDVDDSTVGATPDASTPYTLAITSVGGGGPIHLAITEAAPWSSGNSPATLAADWFEVTNLGSSSVNLAGWKMDDNSSSFAVSVPLSGVSTISPGQSVIFLELASPADLAAKAQAFVDLWFGGTAPAGLQIGGYSGAGVGLSTGGDAINLFDGVGTVHAAISFGASPSGSPLPTFDNAAGLDNAVISTLSAVGVDGAFAAPGDAIEVGSPGTIAAGATPIVGVTALDGMASEAGSDPGVFRFTRSGSTTSAMTVVYAIATGAGQTTADDYTPALTGSQLIPAGAASVDVAITPVDDAAVEGAETLTLTLSDTGSYDVGPDASATITIQDNDTATPAPSVVISEVAPWSSGNSPASLAADWFEVTNTGSTPLDVTGWKVDDNSHAFATAIALNGVTTIAPGEAVIFIETANLASASMAFRNLWFGASPQRVPQIGSYSGSGVGLGTGGDEVVLFDGAGNMVTGVGFGASPGAAPFATFDNHAGAGASALPLPLISTLSAVGVNGALVPPGDVNEIGSPGIGNVGRLIITEVAPWASSGTPYLADWFEVTNIGSAAVDMTGWKVDDNSNSAALSVPIVGLGSVAPGQSAVLIEGTGTTAGNLVTAWYGSTPPAGFLIGSYTGSGVGLGTGGDAVNLFNPSGKLMTAVQFGAATTGLTFDNVAGLATVTTLSAAGVNGAFLAPDGVETGSPGKTR